MIKIFKFISKGLAFIIMCPVYILFLFTIIYCTIKNIFKKLNH